MKYLARGMGAILAYDTVQRFGDLKSFSVDCLQYQEHIIEASNHEDALHRAYLICGDGFWLDNRRYCYFDQEPEIVDPPEDQLMLFLGPAVAPCLPGFEGMLCHKS